MKRTSVLVSVLLLSTFCMPAFAQEGHGYEFGVFAGWAEWRERQYQIGFPQAVPAIDVDYDLNGEVVGGMRLNFLSRRYWGGEVTYSYQQNTLSLASNGGSPVQLDGAVHHALYNQVFYPRRYETGRIKPYFTGGIGAAGYTLNAQAVSEASQAGFGAFSKLDYRLVLNYGAGIKSELGEHAGVRLDFRHHFSEVPTYGVPKSGPGPFLPFDGKLQTLEMTVGFYYRTAR